MGLGGPISAEDFSSRARQSNAGGFVNAQEAIQGGDLQGKDLIGLKAHQVAAGHHGDGAYTFVELGQGLRERICEDIRQCLWGEEGPMMTGGGGVKLEDDREHGGGSVLVWEQNPPIRTQ